MYSLSSYRKKKKSNGNKYFYSGQQKFRKDNSSKGISLRTLQKMSTWREKLV